MSKECAIIHNLLHGLKRHSFPFVDSNIPLNGIYVLFEKGEAGHQQDRIVRVGTHNGKNQLRPRLKQHFLNKNKDRSIFRKNIGRALLNQNNDPFLKFWNLDLTTRKAKDKYSSQIDIEYQQAVEERVSEYIQEYFSFSVFEVAHKKDRLETESKLISTVSWCTDCGASSYWLGNNSPKTKIVKSGLWLVNQLYKEPFDSAGTEEFSRSIKKE